jgi:hypothetical protein
MFDALELNAELRVEKSPLVKSVDVPKLIQRLCGPFQFHA